MNAVKQRGFSASNRFVDTLSLRAKLPKRRVFLTFLQSWSSRCHKRGPLWGAGLCVALLAGVLAGPVRSSEVAGSEDCMQCHGEPGIERIDGGQGSVFVDPTVLGASPHAGLNCASCHEGVDIPHEARLPRVRCVTCHGDAAEAVSNSAHGDAHEAGSSACVDCHGGHDALPTDRMGLETCATCHADVSDAYKSSAHARSLARGEVGASTCRNCHGSAHSVLSAGNPESPTHQRRLAQTCSQCHADRALMIRRQIAIPAATALYESSVHGRSERADAATCSDCHESHAIKPAKDPTSAIHYQNVAHTCGRCHAAEAASYATSIHATGVARGITAAPTCTSCHGEHLIRGPHDPESPVAASAITTTCAHCHEATGIRETYGLPAGRLSTYRESFHGLAARGGSPAVANCASCHGFHDIIPSTDPRSWVSPARLPETCGRCHPGASERFAMGAVHVAINSPSHPVLYAVRWIYLVLIGGTILGMIMHNGLDFLFKVRRQWVRSRPGAPEEPVASGAVRRWFLRMTRFERAQHLLLLVSFFLLVYTGFALKFPETWLFAWLARLEYGYEWRSLIHRGAAVVMVVVSFVHIGYLMTRRGRETLSDLLPRLGDLGDVGQNLMYLTGRRAQPPAFERFGYVEKLEYWALVWGTVVMTITGFVLWFENEALQLMSKWVLDLATLVHYYEAWLAFLAIVIWHVYAHIANPDVYPMNWTWLTGQISEEQLRHEHRAEWERIVAAEREAADKKED